MVKWYHEKQKATQIIVCLDGNVQQYAMSFLHIFNNAREFPNSFYKVENIGGRNDVFVTCRPSDAEEIKEYLEQFGEIRSTEEIDWFIIKAQYDSKGWDEIWGSGCEVDFAVEID